jgi:FtsZ-binding cell division protein ZapB
MKFFVLLLFSAVLLNVSSQNMLKNKYDQLFPNNKSLQIMRLQTKVDSLQRLNDSLIQAQKGASNAIDNLKEEVETLKLALQKAEDRVLDYNAELLQEVIVLRDSMETLAFPHVICTEESIIKKGFIHPNYKNTCNWRSYQIIELGVSDNKGRYTWTTDVYEKTNDSLIQITATNLFKTEKIAALEKLINQRLEEDFKALKISNPECIGRRKAYPSFKLSDMRIAFNQNSEISFEVIYGLTEACYMLNSASTNLKIIELREYFVE